MGPGLSTVHTACWRILFAVLLGLALAGCSRAEEPGLRGAVEWIYDGDTIEVKGAGKVRLIGIDTPERDASPRDAYFRKQGVAASTLRRVAAEALRFNIAAAKGRQVLLTTDGDERDRHGRLLAYVTLPDGRLLNRLLIEKGFAAVYRRFDFRMKQDFLQAEGEARQHRRGLWAHAGADRSASPQQ